MIDYTCTHCGVIKPQRDEIVAPLYRCDNCDFFSQDKYELRTMAMSDRYLDAKDFLEIKGSKPKRYCKKCAIKWVKELEVESE